MRPTPLERWHRLLETNDVKALDDLLAEDATFQSPIVHKPQGGKPIASMYLKAAMSLLNNGTFRYVNEWVSERSAVLEFEAEIDGVAINGVDMIFWNDDGKIERFKVMLRPLKAINLMHELMAKRFGGGAAGS